MERGHPKSWRSIARLFVNVKPGTLCRIAHDADYEPKDPLVRSRLGLPEFPKQIMAPACPKCGEAHTTKRCTRKPTFEDRCNEYIDWLIKQRNNIANLITWADQEAH